MDQTPPPFAFRGTVYDGEAESVQFGGLTLTATVYNDDDADPPWEREDGHGPVTDWRRYGDNVHPTKAPGERVLIRDGRTARFYDFAAAVRTAKAEGWDAEPYGEGTPGQRAVRAVEVDFKYLADWCADLWRYVGVAVTVTDEGGLQLVGKYDHACWGLDSISADHVNEVAGECAADALAVVLKVRAERFAAEAASLEASRPDLYA